MSELTDALDKKGQDMEALHRCTKILFSILSYPLSSPIYRLRHRDMEQVERDGLMEVRRLRVQLNSAEQEVNEVGGPPGLSRGERAPTDRDCRMYVCVRVCAQLRQTVPILQRELQESKSHLTKMQSSSSSSVAGLLQELKAAEDALSRERR